MRAERVEDVVAGPECQAFWSAILLQPPVHGCVSYREPRWYAVRFGQINERLMLRLLDLIGLPYHIFTYLHQVGRQRETTRSWLPGYMFVEFDAVRDDWGQLNRVPGIVEVLGGPTPLDTGVVEDLVERLPRRLPKNGPDTEVPVGTEVRITDGMFRGHVGKVIKSDRRQVTVLWMMFGHLREQTLRTADVEVVA